MPEKNFRKKVDTRQLEKKQKKENKDVGKFFQENFNSLANNSLARAFTKQQREVGMTARCGIMLIRGRWDGPVTSEYCDEMG